MSTENVEWERPRYSENYDVRQFTPFTREDILRGFAELIKNACDSYERKNFNKNYSDAKILVKYGSMIDKNRKFFQIIDFAEGMDFNTFYKAVVVGEKTSGIDKVKTVTGSQGYGLNEACWAFQEATVYSIKNNRITICKFKNDDTPKLGWIKKDARVTEEERGHTQINSDGTFIEGILPSKESIPHFRADTAYEKLCKNFLLRKINTSPKFQILFYDLEDTTATPKRILYTYPEGIIKREGIYEFKIEKYGTFDCDYKIYMTKKSVLESFGDTAMCGLLIYYSEFSVLDNSLLGFDSHRLANRIFGEIKIDGPVDKMLDKNERIFGEKRKGLYKDHEFYKKLSDGIRSVLDAFLHTEERSLYDRSRDVSKDTVENINSLLREMNRIFKNETQETTDIDVPPDPYRPKNGLSFCDYNFISITEFEPRGVYLVADMEIIPDNSKVEIMSNNQEIKIEPKEVGFNKEDSNERNICKKKIKFFSNTPEAEGKIIAKVKNELYSTELLVKVKENPKLHFKGNLAFVPSQKTLIDGERDYVSLVIRNNIIKIGDTLQFSCEDSFLQFEKDIKLSKYNLNLLTKDISELKIELFGRGIDKKTKLKANHGTETTTLEIEIISSTQRKFRGYFREIKDDDTQNTNEIQHYDNGVIVVHTDHPMFKYYMKLPNYQEELSYRTFYADVVVRSFVGELTRKKLIEFNTGISARDQYLQEFDKYYHKYSAKLHKFVVSLETIEKLKNKTK